MNNNLTEIVFILDRSGSMQHLTQDTIGGFNSFVEKQKQEDGEAQVTTILFDDQYEILHDGVNLKDIPQMTTKDYSARGMTALLDAIGKTINTVGDRLNKTDDDEKPSKVIFIITTDGDENASKEFGADKIKKMVKHQTDKYNWEFIFLGANIDSFGVADSIGVMRAANYTPSSVGTDSLYMTVSNSLANYRTNGVIEDNWSDTIR